MTSERDIERLLDRWFTERPIEVADRVLDDVGDRIGRQPQQPAWRVSWRDSQVQTNLKTLLAAAAVIVIAVTGFAVLRPGSGSNVGGATLPSPSASASPSTSPSASAVFPQWYSNSEISAAAGILPAGDGTSRAFVPRVTFTVPAGWVNGGDANGYYELFPDTPANQAAFAATGDLAQKIGMAPLKSPYVVCDAWEDNRGTAAEMVASMAANDAIAASEPIDVAIGGLTGKQVDVRVDPGWTERCPSDPPTFDIGDTRARAILLDSPDRGVIVILINSLHSAGHEAFVADAMPIVESFQFDLSG